MPALGSSSESRVRFERTAWPSLRGEGPVGGVEFINIVGVSQREQAEGHEQIPFALVE